MILAQPQRPALKPRYIPVAEEVLAVREKFVAKLFKRCLNLPEPLLQPVLFRRGHARRLAARENARNLHGTFVVLPEALLLEDVADLFRRDFCGPHAVAAELLADELENLVGDGGDLLRHGA